MGETSLSQTSAAVSARRRALKWCLLFLALGVYFYVSVWMFSSGIASFKLSSNSCAPFEIHLGATEDPTTMRVTWRTRESDCSTIVRYAGADVSDFDSSARTVYGITYEGDSSMLCGHEASRYEYTLQLHTAVMTGLKPGRNYSYAVPFDNRRFTFNALTEKGDNSSYEFLVFGDMGVTMDSRGKYAGAIAVQSAMLNDVRNHVPRLILEIGDISYANGNPNMWDAFMAAIEPFTTQSPWVSGVGNHEYDLYQGEIDPWGLEAYQPKWGSMHTGDARGECGLHIYWRFPFGQFFSPLQTIQGKSFLPAPSYGDAFPPFYYSFDQGPVHIVMISTEHDVEPGSPQITWLAKDLANVDRCKTPFVIATGHRPFYASAKDLKDYNTGRGLRDGLEEILVQHRVDTFISGHVHAYYRICEAKNSTCVAPGQGLISMVIGTAGHRLDDIDREDFPFEEMIFLRTWGYGKFYVNGYHSLEFAFIGASTGDVLDSYSFQNQGLCRKA